ncbi:O-antigen ligase family protein [Opitutaceae bacterium]|nr:O-antigen ligase family protein [Opitutaceae bacterium]
MSLWVLISSFNPSFEIITFFEQEVYRPITPFSWLPSSALPSETRQELSLLLVIFLSTFNVALNFERREPIKILLLIISVNAAFIAILGSIQKLGNAEGIFWTVSSPNDRFFGSFIYHNHWGAYALMSIAVLIGISHWLHDEHTTRGPMYSPAMLCLVGAILILVAIPLSTSRSCTGLAVILLLYAGVRFTKRLYRHGRLTPQIVGLLLAAFILTGLGTYHVAKQIISGRIKETILHFTGPENKRYLTGRQVVYADTIRMIQDKPVAGWGLESFALVHHQFSTVEKGDDGTTPKYIEAHSDWLQAVAEVGLVGLVLALSCVLVPAIWVLKRINSDHVAHYCFVATTIVMGLALVEFPLANPAVCLAFGTIFYGGCRLSSLSPIRHHHHRHLRAEN